MESLKSIIKKIMFNEKKVSKSALKEMDLDKFITIASDSEDIASLLKNRIVLGLVKVYVRKFKYLLDDGNELLLKLSHKESIRIVRNKNISLKVETRDFYVTDDLLQDKGEQLGNEWADFDNVSIEAMRDESGGLGSTLIEGIGDQLDSPKKKRKLIEDETTEYEVSFYKRNICNPKNTIVDKAIPDCLTLSKDFYINTVFQKCLEVERITRVSDVEKMRDETVLDNFEVSDQFDVSYDNAVSDASSDENKYSGVLSTTADFVFNSRVADLKRLDKAKEFLKLLELAGEGTLKCIQETPFAPILCKVKN